MSGQTDPIVLAIITLVFVITLVLIVAEKMDKAILALIGSGIAIVVLLLATNFSLLAEEFEYRDVHNFIGHELEILGLIVGMTIVVDVAAKSGLFQHIAIRIIKQTRGENKAFGVSRAPYSRFHCGSLQHYGNNHRRKPYHHCLRCS